LLIRKRRESDKRADVGPYQTRGDPDIDLGAVRAGIGTALRMIHSDVLREEVPDRITELIKQLEQEEAGSA
jgi:Anti-sigma factor NepR